MAKRFTETKKWEDPWFQELDPTLKCVWGYILDHCDNAGVWVVNTKLMGFQIGKPILWETIKAKFGRRLYEFAPGKAWVPKFIEFQYGTLSEACKPHQKIIALLKSHTLWEPYTKGIHTLQEEDRDREEEEDQDLGDGGSGEEGPREAATPLTVFDQARRCYPGTKRGLSVEWVNFTKKHPNFGEIVPLLLPAITREREHKAALKAARIFCPEWKNFGTWLNQSCWTQEFPPVEASNGTNPEHPSRRESQAERNARAARENWGDFLPVEDGAG